MTQRKHPKHWMRYLLPALILGIGAISSSAQQQVTSGNELTGLPNAPSATVTKDEGSAEGVVASPDEIQPTTLAMESIPNMGPSRVADRKFLLLSSLGVGMTILDVESTQHGLARGGSEVNTIVGERPSRVELYAISAVFATGVIAWSYALKKNARHSKRWLWPLIPMSASHAAGATWNYSRFTKGAH